MASLLLGCGAVLSTRLRRRRQAAREQEREFAQDFEKLRQANEDRVKRLSTVSQYSSPHRYDYSSESRDAVDAAGGEEEEPPAYEEERAAVERRVRPKGSMVDRRDWAVPRAAGVA